jgi:ribosomal protein S18 acetylase RimI-like enzyme
MGLTYFKRYRMELDLRGRDFSQPQLPAGYYFVPWQQTTTEEHAQVKHLCFHQEIDSQVFPCLSDYAGCLRLMNEIARKPGFLPKATWLLCTDVAVGKSRFDTANLNESVGYGNTIVYSGTMKVQEKVRKVCGTIQGIIDNQGFGAIQNLGIVPELRGQGLGTCLLFKALQGFSDHGVNRAMLEVTSQNDQAVKLYKRIGFMKIRTVYKVIEGALT